MNSLYNLTGDCLKQLLPAGCPALWMYRDTVCTEAQVIENRPASKVRDEGPQYVSSVAVNVIGLEII